MEFDELGQDITMLKGRLSRLEKENEDTRKFLEEMVLEKDRFFKKMQELT